MCAGHFFHSFSLYPRAAYQIDTAQSRGVTWTAALDKSNKKSQSA